MAMKSVRQMLLAKAALRQQVTRELYAQRCVQAKTRAEKEVIWQLGDEVTGPLPKQLVGGNYFAEQRQFNLSLQANGINFDRFLSVRGPDGGAVPALAAPQAERKLRSWLGLLLVAEAEGLQPTETEVTAALTDWNEKLDGERTFPANDARKVRQRLCPCKGDGLCAGAFHPDPAAGGTPCTGTASEIRKKAVFPRRQIGREHGF